MSAAVPPLLAAGLSLGLLTVAQIDRAPRLIWNATASVPIGLYVVRASHAPSLDDLVAVQRDGVAQDGRDADLFGSERDDLDRGGFAARCEDDRHHFRFIVSPEDAGDLEDLHAFTRDLMARAERDLGTGLDWVAVDHWNTDNPHIHILVRGKADDGRDLVISRDYISRGLRARAEDLLQLELGPRSEREISQALETQVTAEQRLQSGGSRRSCV